MCVETGLAITLAACLVLSLFVTLIFSKRVKMQSSRITKLVDDNEKFDEFYKLLLLWIEAYQDEKRIEAYFESNGYNTVAIYGMKELGEVLYYDLRKGGIEVKYAIDINAEDVCSELKVSKPDENLDDVDVIVVTAIHYYDSIKTILKEKVNANIVSLFDVIYEVSIP